MQHDPSQDASLGGPPAPGPGDACPAETVGRVRGPSGEELEVAELRVPPADIEKLRKIVLAWGGIVMPSGRTAGDSAARSVAVVHPMGPDGMHLVDLRSSVSGSLPGMLTAFRDVQML